MILSCYKNVIREVVCKRSTSMLNKYEQINNYMQMNK
jgi:hypothetical protein